MPKPKNLYPLRTSCCLAPWWASEYKNPPDILFMDWGEIISLILSD